MLKLAVDIQSALGNAFRRGTASRLCGCDWCGKVSQEQLMLTNLWTGKRLCLLCAELDEFRDWAATLVSRIIQCPQ